MASSNRRRMLSIASTAVALFMLTAPVAAQTSVVLHS